MDKAKKEILRYLGRSRQDVPEDLSVLIDECAALMRGAANVRVTRRTFGIQHADADSVRVGGTALVLKGGIISRHLCGCKQVVLLAATLGVAADNLIRVHETTDLTKSLILDACATQLIEESCDEIEAQIREQALAEGLSITRRFSPGYGDFPIETQPVLLAVLDANRKIGLTCTESLIMLPRKSVTAVIGLGKELGGTESGCHDCTSSDTCQFRKV